MGIKKRIWGFINSIAETGKRNAPNPTALTDTCKTSIQRFNGCMRDEETRSLISLFALKFAKNAAFKMIPGARVLAETISETINEVKSKNLQSPSKNISETINDVKSENHQSSTEIISETINDVKSENHQSPQIRDEGNERSPSTRQ